MQIAWFMDGDLIALQGDLCQVSIISGRKRESMREASTEESERREEEGEGGEGGG